MFLMFGLSSVFPWFFAGSWFSNVSVLLVQAKPRKYRLPQKPQVIDLQESHGDCEEFSESGLSDRRGDFEGSVDFSEGLTKWDYGRISESSSQFGALPSPAQVAILHDFTHSLSHPQFRNSLPRLPGFGWPVF